MDLVENEWINQKIEIKENLLSSGQVEYEAKFYYRDAYYLLNGKIDKDEFIKIIKNLNYF